MATPLAQAFVRIRPTGATFKPETEKIINSVDGDSAGKKIGSDVAKGAKKTIGPGFKGAFAGAFSGLIGAEALTKVVDGFKGVVAAGRESNKVAALSAQVIKTTGGAANLSAKQVGNLATAISNKTGVDDEQIQSGENLLLTFTSVRNEVGKGNDIFNQATQTITDMSTALGQDTKSSAIQLGKALNDPIKGVTALQRVGVSFTESQKAQIASMVKSGNTLGAQKLILGELNKEFGGAAAASTTNAQKLSVQADNLRESFGQKLIPIIDGLSAGMLHLFIILGAGAAFVGAHATAFKILGAGLLLLTGITLANTVAIAANEGTLATWFAEMTIVKAATAAWAAVQATMNLVLAANPIVLVVLALAALAIGLVIAYKKSETFRDIVNGAFHAIQAVVGAVVGFITAHWKLLFAILTGPVGLAVLFITSHFGGIVSFFKGLPGKIGAVIGGVNAVITAPFRAAFNAISDLWNGTAGQLSFKVPGWVPGLGGKGFSMPKLPHLALGTSDWAGGFARVGERGPEDVWLPQHAQVFPHGQGPTSGGGAGGPLVHADQINVMSGSADEIGEKIWFRMLVRGL